MDTSDRRPRKKVNRLTDKAKGIYFKVVQTGSGFNLYESKDKINWELRDRNLTLDQVMQIETNIFNSNILNHLNFLSILRRRK
jgi:hypothetical protein